nr:truncated hemoglobins [uncultured bacterium]
MTARSDILTQDDVRLLVHMFYGGIDAHPVLGRFFADLDLPGHLPRMVAFWSSVVFQTGTYHGRPFDAHVRLEGLAAEHFAAWLARFEATVDRLFAGPNAETVKARAHQIGFIFQAKLGLLATT